jgi:hypothetical protein
MHFFAAYDASNKKERSILVVDCTFGWSQCHQVDEFLCVWFDDSIYDGNWKRTSL